MSNDAKPVMDATTKHPTPNPRPLSPDQDLQAYREMVKIRRFEEKAGQLYAMGAIGGFCHLYIGQEAVVVGLQMVAKKGDQVITSYRDHGHMLAAGLSPKGVMAELTGRALGYCKGKGGSMHMFSKEREFYGGHGIVGASVPLGAGLAFANRYRGNDNVCFCYFGDGATNQGQVYETFNMAGRWKLPIIFIIENNKHTTGKSIERSSPTPNLASRGLSFGIPGQQVDGMDVRAVKQAGDTAANAARSGQGPFILEMLTSPYRGHAMMDQAKESRKGDALKEQRFDHDPIAKVRNRLLASGYGEDDLAEIDGDVRNEINAAAEFAQNAPEPEPSELMTDILA
ncbi:MAG: pyruvate dehydrogenase (acetyl-transferring) E1 component subunit alpha [Hyphomicrobiaceae bacterium]